MQFIPLTWEELIKYNKNTSYKNRPIIIVDLDDEMNKKYNAIVVKYDNKKNVHIRYLDNPYYKDKYWWTGNKNNIPGLNPLSYHAICIGDIYDEMDDLYPSDFQDDGYDDIINYEKEPNRFFKSNSTYPYLDGIQGNVYVNNYYLHNFYQDLNEGKIPECILKKIDKNNVQRIKIKKKIDNKYDLLLCNILEALPKKYFPIVDEYFNNKNINIVISNFKKLLSNMMTNYFINKYSKNIGIDNNELILIKEELKNGANNINLIKIIPYLIGYNIKIFDCDSNDLNIIEYIYAQNKNYIYLLKYLDKLETLL